MSARLYKRVLFILMLVPAIGEVKAQQTFSYTQYMDNLTPVNPAFSLLSKDGSIHTIVRKQWLGINGAPTSYLFNANFQLKEIGSAWGIISRDDEFSVEHITYLNGFFAKSIELNEDDKLAVSLTGGLKYYNTNYASLDPLDPAARNDVKQLSPNVGLGLMYYTDNYYVGLSVPDITFKAQTNNLPDSNNNNWRNTYYLAGGYMHEFDDDLKIKPSAMLCYVRGVPLIADVSTMFYTKDVFGFGASYRTNAEAAAIISFDINTLHFGYSYQFGTSSNTLGGGSGSATHEVSMAIHFGRGNQVPINFGN